MLSQAKILGSIQSAVEKSTYVAINERALERYVNNFSPIKQSHWSKVYPLVYKKRARDEDELDFLFLIGSQAFCFWGYPRKWTVTHREQKLDGWWALIACLKRALEKGSPVLDGRYLARLSLKDAQNLFAGEPEIPLLLERKEILNNIGKTLANKYHGRFHNFFRQANKDVFSLLEQIVTKFTGFNDVSVYKGEKVFFYKKAQLVLADIFEVFNGRGFGELKHTDQLLGYADYKIPAILRKLGILVYSDELREKVDKRMELRAGSEMEVEIRANMLWATNLICQKLKPRVHTFNPITLNGILWNKSQQKHKTDKPYHLTKTIYY